MPSALTCFDLLRWSRESCSAQPSVDVQTEAVGDAVRSLGCSWDEAGVRRPDGRFLMRYTAEQFSPRLGEPTIGVHRGELQALLVRSLPADVVKTGVCCTGIDQSERGVTVHFQNGDSAEADIVVGADGRRSLVTSGAVG